MITILENKEFTAIRKDGVQVTGSCDEILFQTIFDMINGIKTEEDIKQEFIDEKLSELTDEEALDKIVLIKDWKSGIELAQDNLVKYKDTVYRLIKGLTPSTNIYPPDRVPSEYKRLEKVGVLPEYSKYTDGTVRDLGANPYSKGEQIKWNGQVCTWTFSTPGAWSPTVYAPAWECK